MDSDQTCPINDYLGECNELLFDIGMELREQRGGSLSLVCFRTDEPKVTPFRQENLVRSNAFVRWLLRTHVCINGLKLRRKRETAHIPIIQELPENSWLKSLKLEFPRGDSVQAAFAALLPRLRSLEELHCYAFRSTNILLAAISALLRNTTCLTSLVFRVCLVKDQLPQTFINALAANTTLKCLELWANWNSLKTRERVGAYIRSNTLVTNLHHFGEVTDGNEFLLLDALVCNSTLSTLHINGLKSGENSARFLTRILTDCTSLRKLTIDCRAVQYVISEATLIRCVEALAGNDTLEELHLSCSLWRPTHWIVSFGFLPKNKRLKKLDIFRTLFCD
ncbi:hypothetical protein HPB51_004248 [Rhipicephalus microplus]|uniref:Uncharacterized protein n=1 Tax=Rhipicephalus microplus TaxID=6941 RepID=A0A9J6EQU0_RHIMP|nr:hypothetical protein HPB51_004248 [Rhipicephalus microplus]